jgi:hypothetical protein
MPNQKNAYAHMDARAAEGTQQTSHDLYAHLDCASLNGINNNNNYNSTISLCTFLEQ